MGESVAALLVEFRNCGRRSPLSRSNGTNQEQNNTPRAQVAQPLTKMRSSSGTEGTGSKGGHSEQYNVLKPLGLGIVTKKFKHKRFQGKMTRVTEVSENLTNMVSVVEPEIVSEHVTNVTSVEVVPSTEE